MHVHMYIYIYIPLSLPLSLLPLYLTPTLSHLPSLSLILLSSPNNACLMGPDTWKASDSDNPTA